ncbi:hypothetical protein [Brevundimonas sp. CEF1]|uniref:hypothetical protein n=1 Tax=Brevundimonas sp. CEF1 TaxID=3442642 RepID=UPI003F519449
MIRIDSEFRAYIPPLSDEERQQLEANIVADGCRDPLLVWDDVLIDGHNRYEICTRLGLAYETVQKEFADRDAALDWMDAHQLGRRNLTPDARKLLLGRRYNRVKRAPTDNLVQNSPKDQNDTSGVNTAAKLAKEHGVSEATVKRAGKFAEEVEKDEGLKAAVEAGQSVAQVKRERALEERSDEPDAPPSEAVEKRDTHPAEPAETIDPAEAKARREIAQLPDEAKVDEIIGLRAEVIDLRNAVQEQKANNARLKSQLRDHDGDKDAAIRRLNKTLEHKSSEMFRAKEEAARVLRHNNALKKENEKLKAEIENQVFQL